MFRSLVHIGIAVRDLGKSEELFRRLLGIAPDHREDVVDQGVRTVMFSLPGTGLELLEATRSDSPIARFIEQRGEGIHHLSFAVDDIRQELARLKKDGFELVDHEPRTGAGGYDVAFLHPRSTNGVLVEICQGPSPVAGKR